MIEALKLISQLGKTFLKGRIAKSEAKAKSAADWESIAQQNAGNSWKDEWLTLTFSGIFICHFIGPLQPFMNRGWEILAQANDYYWVIILTIVGGSFGVSTLRKFKK